MRAERDGLDSAPQEASAPLAQGDAFDRLEARTEARVDRMATGLGRRLHLASRFLAYFLLPLVLIAAGIVFLSVLMWGRLGSYWTFIAVYFLPFGIETGIPYGVAVGLPPAVMIATILWVNLWGTLFLVWNLRYLDQVPWLGKRLQRIEDRTEQFWYRHPKLRDLGVVGLGLFVLLPLSGSGAVPGSLLGRIGSFPWALTWLAIFLGSAVRVVTYTFAALGVRDLFF